MLREIGYLNSLHKCFAADGEVQECLHKSLMKGHPECDSYAFAATFVPHTKQEAIDENYGILRTCFARSVI